MRRALAFGRAWVMLRVGILSDAPAVLTANKTLALRNKYSWAKFEYE